MPHYIRFLKPPKILPSSSTSTVESLITITTDLGDSFLASDANLLASLYLTNTTTTNQTTTTTLSSPFTWRAGMRELKITMGPYHRNIPSFAACSVRLCVCDASTTTTMKGDGGLIVDRLEPSGAPGIVAAWSGEFGAGRDDDAGGRGRMKKVQMQAEKLVERRFEMGVGPRLSSWEETGNSIARHIWDAALGSVMEIQHAYMGLPGSIPSLQRLFAESQNTGRRGLRVLELGAGCGIVGTAMAQIVPRCSVLLTDLEEVRDIISRNLTCATLADSSSARFQVLDWDDEELPEDITSHGYDLIAVSDCTYNSDSLPALVRILGVLVEVSPTALVLVALKKRHESEEVFFELMGSAGFEIDSHNVARLPSVDSEAGSVDIELYAFRKDAPARGVTVATLTN
ncbi:hypothetical protein FQN50_003997 [Emmonsiellopsis sp. PD_5]|nr:hypothetical protein FQN50_003997 [Emmonsiellopsis sp. PD_5]